MSHHLVGFLKPERSWVFRRRFKVTVWQSRRVPTVAVIVQHGEKMRESGDPALSDRGHRQAKHVASALASLEPAAIISSPQLRAPDRATLAEQCGVSVQIDPRLRERMNLEPGQDLDQFTWTGNAASWIGDGSRPAGGRR